MPMRVVPKGLDHDRTLDLLADRADLGLEPLVRPHNQAERVLLVITTP
ncbi:MAG: hypothetical protein JOY71_23980 [Acetobacteraceae bacterium]|nr:hypothetical protein [Acetobacteraceae bacterium]